MRLGHSNRLDGLQCHVVIGEGFARQGGLISLRLGSLTVISLFLSWAGLKQMGPPCELGSTQDVLLLKGHFSLLLLPCACSEGLRLQHSVKGFETMTVVNGAVYIKTSRPLLFHWQPEYGETPVHIGMGQGSGSCGKHSDT